MTKLKKLNIMKQLTEQGNDQFDLANNQIGQVNNQIVPVNDQQT